MHRDVFKKYVFQVLKNYVKSHFKKCGWIQALRFFRTSGLNRKVNLTSEANYSTDAGKNGNVL